jgi:hypothetical protein
MVFYFLKRSILWTFCISWYEELQTYVYTYSNVCHLIFFTYATLLHKGQLSAASSHLGRVRERVRPLWEFEFEYSMVYSHIFFFVEIQFIYLSVLFCQERKWRRGGGGGGLTKELCSGLSRLNINNFPCECEVYKGVRP